MYKIQTININLVLFEKCILHIYAIEKKNLQQTMFQVENFFLFVNQK